MIKRIILYASTCYTEILINFRRFDGRALYKIINRPKLKVNKQLINIITNGLVQIKYKLVTTKSRPLFKTESSKYYTWSAHKLF